MGVRRSSPVLVGREAELRALEAAVAARAERPVVLLGGEAGVGKSRLVLELRARATAGGATVAVGSCVQLGADVLPYAPFVESLARLVEALGDGADELLGPARPDLATLLPDLESRPEKSRDGGGSRGRMYEAVRGLLDRAPEPLVLVLEDVHWADRSTLELLAYLARRLRHGRTLLLATYRTDELHRRHPLLPVLAELERGGRATRIELARLDRAGVARIVREIRGEAVPAALVEAIAGRSEGNPFLVEELLAAEAGPTTLIPATLKDLLLARVGSIEAPTRRALGIVAAVGRPVEAELVEAVWDGAAADLDGALRDAIDRALLIVEPAGRKLAFRHALLAEAIDDDLLPGERVRLHATLARILAERPDLASPTPAGAAGELAHHLLAARDLPAAFDAAVRAAAAAATARAYPEARELYERALELFEQVPEAPARAGIDRAGLLDQAAEASFHAGDAARAVALGRLAVGECEGAGDPTRAGYHLVRLIEWTEETGDSGALSEIAERALALVPEEPSSPERAFALLGRAAALLHQSRNRDQVKAAAEAARVAAACGASGYEAIARSIRGTGLVGLGRDEEAIEEVERAAVLAATSGGTEEVVIVSCNRLVVYGFSGHLERLGGVLAEARRALDREGSLVLTEPYLDLWEAVIHEWQGRRAEAEVLLSEHIGRGAAGPTTRSELLSFRGVLRVRCGLLGEGEDDLRAALGLGPAVFAETAAEAFGSLAEAALVRGDLAGALDLVDEGLAGLDPTDDVSRRAHLHALGLRVAADMAERSRARRERELAAVASTTASRHRERLQAALDGRLVEEGGANDLVRAMGAWGLAEASRCAGGPDPGLWAVAAAALAAVGGTHLAAYCRFREAEAALAGPGDRARAERALREARTWVVMVGAEPLRRDVDAFARRARLDLAATETTPDAPPSGGSAASAPGTDPYGLSPREREVLAFLVDGRTNREIGAALFISDKTASVHVSHILDKLGVTSRGAAAALAARGGFVDTPGE
jgi:DNA-binding CsgD family transcriptional regulator/tetratricopeptide (TPR) repeat protein